MDGARRTEGAGGSSDGGLSPHTMAMVTPDGASASTPPAQGHEGHHRAPDSQGSSVLAGLGQHLRLCGQLQQLQQLLQGPTASPLGLGLQPRGPPSPPNPVALQTSAASLLRLAEVRRLALALSAARSTPQGDVAPPTGPGGSLQQQQQQSEQQRSHQQLVGSGMTLYALRVLQALREQRLLAGRPTVGGGDGGNSPQGTPEAALQGPPPGSPAQSLQGPPSLVSCLSSHQQVIPCSPAQVAPQVLPQISSSAAAVAGESLRLLYLLRRRRQGLGGLAPPQQPPSAPAPVMVPSDLPWHALVHAETGLEPPLSPTPPSATSSPLRLPKPRDQIPHTPVKVPPTAETRGPFPGGPPPPPRRGSAPGGPPPHTRGVSEAPGPRKRRLQRADRRPKRPSMPPPDSMRAPNRGASQDGEAPTVATSTDSEGESPSSCDEQMLSAAAAAAATIPPRTAAELLRAPCVPLRIEGMHAVGAPQLLQGRRHIQRFECPLCSPLVWSPDIYLTNYNHYVDYHWKRRRYLGAFVCFPCRLVSC